MIILTLKTGLLIKKKRIKKMTEKEIKIINNYLLEVVKNNYKCQHCSMCHYNNICFLLMIVLKKILITIKKKIKNLLLFFIKKTIDNSMRFML